MLLGDPLCSPLWRVEDGLPEPVPRTEYGSLSRPIKGGDVDEVSNADGEERGYCSTPVDELGEALGCRSTAVDELGESLKACSAFRRVCVSHE